MDTIFKGSEFDSCLKSIGEAFTSLSDELDKIATENAKVSLFWKSSDATEFESKLGKVQTNVDKFMEKYGKYITFLNSVKTAYAGDQGNLIEAIKKAAPGEDGSGSSGAER